MKLKRILAWIIDWNLCGVPALLYATLYMYVIGETNVVGMLLFILFVLSYPVIFALRDVILGGRSIAKRIFKLYVVDVATGEEPARVKLVVRNLFFMLYPIDAVMLIVTGKSIGDMVTNTTVIKK